MLVWRLDDAGNQQCYRGALALNSAATGYIPVPGEGADTVIIFSDTDIVTPSGLTVRASDSDTESIEALESFPASPGPATMYAEKGELRPVQDGIGEVFRFNRAVKFVHIRNHHANAIQLRVVVGLEDRRFALKG